MSPPAAQGRGRHQRLPQWWRGGLVVSGIFCWGMSCLPASASQFPLTSATLLGRYGHHFPFGTGGFSGIPHPSLHIQEAWGPCLQALGLLWPCSPQGWLPSFQLAGHEALQAHRGHNQLTFRGVWLLPPILVGSQAVAPQPQCQAC